MARERANPLGIPVGGWITSGDLRGLALPTTGTAAALIEAYRGKSGSRDAETSVIWGRSEPYIHFSSDRGPDVISVLRRAGDEGIYAFAPPDSSSDTLFLYLRLDRTRRAWAVVRACRSEDDQGGDSPADDAGDDAADDEENDEGEDMHT